MTDKQKKEQIQKEAQIRQDMHNILMAKEGYEKGWLPKDEYLQLKKDYKNKFESDFDDDVRRAKKKVKSYRGWMLLFFILVIVYYILTK